MGSTPITENTALAGDLYTTLMWQVVLLLALSTLVFGLWLLRRPLRGSSDSSTVEPTGRRILRIAVGGLWILDGLLQAQPSMPGSFVQMTIAPKLEAVPDWLFGAVDPFTRTWLQHPIAADAVTVWIQVGLGIAILVGGSGRLARAALLGSASWAIFVWVIGELLGDLTSPGASWLTGAPGAALLYAAASLILLLPARSWQRDGTARLLRRIVGVVLVGGAALQALPNSKYWAPSGLFNALSGVAVGGVPGPLGAPVQWLATVLPPHATLANAVLVGLLLVIGGGLLLTVLPRTLSVAAFVLCLGSWWFGQGFGIFGGTGTDPNSGVVLMVLLVAGWPRAEVAVVLPADATPDFQTVSAVPTRLRVAGAILAVGSLIVLPLISGFTLLGPVTAQAAEGDSGGIIATAPEQSPDFTLTDQNGRSLAMHDLRGKLTLVVFLDPECFDSCPLMANQLATAVRSLGPRAASVAILAVDVNPVFNTVPDVRTFTIEHGLVDLPSWHFVTGSATDIGAVLADFGQGVTVPLVGMIGHPQTIFLFGADGRELSALNDSANDDLTDSYTQLITSELQRHL
jgi:cytochrome oxidase Cu insertion factor (SCO1/SenC/PrrC family)/uncharacterized membrane protein YphA (DoxX/SURF4 family)